MVAAAAAARARELTAAKGHTGHWEPDKHSEDENYEMFRRLGKGFGLSDEQIRAEYEANCRAQSGLTPPPPALPLLGGPAPNAPPKPAPLTDEVARSLVANMGRVQSAAAP